MKQICLLFLLIMSVMFSACSLEEKTEPEEATLNLNTELESGTGEDVLYREKTRDLQDKIPVKEETAVSEEDRAAQMEELFGENCIADQTFETELSQYNGKVFVVPYAPSDEETKFYIDIIQDGEKLNSLWDYIPETLEGEAFTSLDAIAFFDINFDDCTDIIMIKTYGNTTFAAVYKGFAKDADEYDRYFYADSVLSENITKQLDNLSIPAIREHVTKGKKNGEFATYQDAYLERIYLCKIENNGDAEYDLIYFNEDDIPELVVSAGTFVSMYTYSEGSLYTLMEHWAYGAMGNAGYEYSPKKNSLRNYNTDFAGLLLYTTYMEMTDEHTLDTVVTIETYNFDDANGNGMPDEEEQDSVGEYGASYIDGMEVTDEECAKYDLGAYEYIFGSMSYEEMLSLLNQ